MMNARKKLISLFTLALLTAPLFAGTLPKSQLEPELGISTCAVCSVPFSQDNIDWDEEGAEIYH